MTDTLELILHLDEWSRRIPLTRAVTLGLSPDSDVVVPDARLSRHHCRLEPDPAGPWRLADLGSSAGTLLNGERLEAPRLVKAGDTFAAGPLVGELHAVHPEATVLTGDPSRDARVVERLLSALE